MQNTGQTSAQQVTLVFEENLKNMENESIYELAFKDSIPTMPPHWKYSTCINIASAITENKGYKLKQGVTLSYSSKEGDEYCYYYILNFAIIKSRRWLITTNSDDPKRSLLSIADSVKSISDHLSM